MQYVSTRGAGARRSASPTCCSPAWPTDGGLYVPGVVAGAADRGRPRGRRRTPTVADGDVALRRRARSTATTSRRSSPRPTPRSTTPTSCPLVRLGRRALVVRSCSTARRWRSRTSPCSSSAGCSTTSSTRRGAAGHDRRRHLRRHRARPPSTACRERATLDIVILHPAGRVTRRAAPADDHGRRAQRAQRRGRRHVRRLPGPREGDVRRRGRSATQVQPVAR